MKLKTIRLFMNENPKVNFFVQSFFKKYHKTNLSVKIHLTPLAKLSLP